MWHKFALLVISCGTLRAEATIPTDAFLARLNGLHKAIVNESYDQSVIPWRGPDVGPVVVNSSFYLQQIVSLNEKEQILTSKVYLLLQWFDPRLQWNPSEHQGVKDIRLPSHTIWKPDIVLENSASTEMFIRELDPHSLLRVFYSGEVTWIPFLFVKTFCPVDATFFPYDEQICPYTFISSLYPDEVLRINPEDNITGPLHRSAEWDIKSITPDESQQEAVYAEEHYTNYYFNVEMKRRTSFSKLVIIIPCVILTLLTLMMFILPAESGQRMDLGLAIWTSLVLFLLIVNDVIPGSSERGRLPILGQCLIVMLILVSLSLTLVIINTLWQGKQFSQLPRWLQLLISCCHILPNTAPTKQAVSRYVDHLSVSVQIGVFLLLTTFVVIFYTV